MKKFVNYCLDNPAVGIMLGIVVLFIYFLFTEPISLAFIGAVFFGILAAPITASILSIINILLE